MTTIKLSNTQLHWLMVSLNDAIAYENDFIDVHMGSDAPNLVEGRKIGHLWVSRYQKLVNLINAQCDSKEKL